MENVLKRSVRISYDDEIYACGFLFLKSPIDPKAWWVKVNLIINYLKLFKRTTYIAIDKLILMRLHAKERNKRRELFFNV